MLERTQRLLTSVIAKLLDKVSIGDVPGFAAPRAEPFDFVGERGALRKRGDAFVIAVGMHKGQDIKSVPGHYLRWAIRAHFEESVKDTLRDELERRRNV